MREEEGRKLIKQQWIRTLMRVKEQLPDYTPDKKWIHSLIQKVRYKRYVLTKENMLYVNEVFSKMKGSQ